MPRKTRLTDDIQATICRYVNAGAPIPQACVAAKVPWPTCKDWLAKGRQGKQPYADFVEAIEQAKAAWVAATAMRITKAADKDWKAGAWLLERRTKAFQPPRFRQEVTGPGGGPVQTHATVSVNSAEAFRAKVLGIDGDKGDE